MATFDVRDDEDEVIDEIVFADKLLDRTFVAYAIKYDLDCGWVEIRDDTDSMVIINNKHHAQNLIKALNKAIEIGWLK